MSITVTMSGQWQLRKLHQCLGRISAVKPAGSESTRTRPCWRAVQAAAKLAGRQ